VNLRQTIQRRLNRHRPRQTHNPRWAPGPEWQGATEFVDHGSDTPLPPPTPVSKLANHEVDAQLLDAVVSFLAREHAFPVEADPAPR
jgi:hypothetical protein